MKKNLIYLAILLFIVSCTSKESTRKIHLAEKLLDVHADSALLVLKSIEKAPYLSEKNAQKYVVLYVLAKYKTYADVRNDTDIFKAAAYFDKKSNKRYKALAFYAAASVNTENKNYGAAMAYYKKAQRALENSDYFLLKALVSINIAHIYDKQYIFAEAVKNYKSALDSYQKLTDKTAVIMSVYTNLGSDYLYLKKTDTALLYYEKAYKMSIELKDTIYQATLLNNIGLSLRELGKNEKALPYFKKALQLQKGNNGDHYRYKLNLAFTYLQLNKMDSAEFYINNLKQSMDSIPDNSYKSAVSGFLKEFYKQKADYATSLKYYEINRNLNNNFMDSVQNSSLLGAERDAEYTYAENQRLKAEKRFYVISIGSILVLFLLVVILLFYNRRILKEKEYGLQLLKEKQNLKERERDLLKKTEQERWSNNLYQYIANEQEEIMHTLYKLTLHHLIKEDDKLINLLETTIKDYKKHLQIANEKLLDTGVFFDITGLKEHEAAKLLNSEKLLLSLLTCNLNNQQIALMIGSSANSVRVRSIKLKAKMEKLGINISDELASRV